jgi:hypothetical protein
VLFNIGVSDWTVPLPKISELEIVSVVFATGTPERSVTGRPEPYSMIASLGGDDSVGEGRTYVVVL